MASRFLATVVEKAAVPLERQSSNYFRGCEAKERDLADRASAPDIRKICLSLAEGYRLLAENAELTERKMNRSNSLSHGEPSPWD